MKRSVAFFLAFVIITLSFAGCKKQTTTGKSFVYPIASQIRSLDPQIAGDDSAAVVLDHAMEGLTRLDESGTPGAGVAKTWEVSEDGLTYTFYLRNDAKWYLNSSAKQLAGDSFDSRVTAHDFVFALQRAADPNTNAPLFHSISAIKNAQKIHDGKAYAANLGVRALDDWTLRVTLERPDIDFLKTVSTAIAFPCNKAFFELTKGRYGLELPVMIFNGPFHVYKWEDTTLSLTRSEEYSSDSPPVAASIGFRVNTDAADIAAKVQDGSYAAASVAGSNASLLQKKEKILLTPRQDTVWAFLINAGDETLANANLRAALLQSFRRELSELPSYAEKATGLVPSIGTVGGKEYRSYAGNVGITAPSSTNAQNSWKKGLTELKKDSLTLTVSCTPEQELLVKKLLQSVQGTIGLTLSLKISTEQKTDEELQRAVTAGNFQIAFAKLQANSDSVYDYLSQFLSSSSQNPIRFRSSAFDTAMGKALLGSSVEDRLKFYKQAESILLNSNCIYPVSFELSYFATAPDVSKVYLRNNGGKVNFIYAERKD